MNLKLPNKPTAGAAGQNEGLLMNIVKFKTGYSNVSKIERVEVLRETDKFVYLPSTVRGKTEYREGKRTDWAQYHDSWGDAHAYLLSKAESDVKVARRQLELANSHLGNIKGMKLPKEVS